MPSKTDTKYLVNGKYVIQDLVDIDRLTKLFNRFSQVTGYTTGFVSYPDLEVLIGTGWRDACTKFHRSCPKGVELCKKSNALLLGKLKEVKELSIEKCEHGLIDGATPVIINGAYVASVATGQVFFKEPDLKWFESHAQRMGFDKEGYIKAIKAVPVVSEEEFKDKLIFLTEIAVMICEMGLQALEEKETALKLKEEIARRKTAESELIKLKENLEVTVMQKTKELVSAQDELIRTAKLAAMGQAAGAIAHEFRNQLGIVRSSAYLLKKKLGSDPSAGAEKHLDTIDKEIQEMDVVMDNILAYAKTRTMCSLKDNVSIKDLLTISLDKVHVPDNIKTDLEVPSDLSLIKADKVQLNRIFCNIISNAVHAMDEGGELTICVSEEKSTIYINFKDTGMGISKEEMKQVFKPFFTKKFRGTGLGLPVCKILTEAHGGSIEMDSEPGKGTNIKITLPLEY